MAGIGLKHLEKGQTPPFTTAGTKRRKHLEHDGGGSSYDIGCFTVPKCGVHLGPKSLEKDNTGGFAISNTTNESATLSLSRNESGGVIFRVCNPFTDTCQTGSTQVVHVLFTKVMCVLARCSTHRLASKVVPVKSSPQTYDKVLAARLWDASAVAAGVSRDVMCAKPASGPNAGQTTGGPVTGEPAGPEIQWAGDDVVRAGLHNVNTGSSTAATVRKSRKLGADIM